MIYISARYPNIKSSCDVIVRATDLDVEKLDAVCLGLDACLFKEENLQWLSNIWPWNKNTFELNSSSFEKKKMGIATRSFAGDPKQIITTISKWISLSEQKFGKKNIVAE